jgi:hypothetical protein
MKQKTRFLRTRRLIPALLALGAAGAMSATISLNLSDYPDVGTRNRLATDTTGHAAVVIGSAGADRTWDFTQTLHGREIGMDFVLPSETPFGASVPGAETAVKTMQWLSVDPVPLILPNGLEGFFDVYYYEKPLPADNILQWIGLGTTVVGPGTTTPIYSGGFIFGAPCTELAYPLSLGKTWLKKYEFSAPAVISGLSTTLVTKDSSVMEVDATGRMTLPVGAYDCVRVKATRYLSLKGLLFGNYLKISVDTLIVYDWYAKDIGLIAEAASHSGEKNPLFTDAGYVARLASTSVPNGVEGGPAATAPAACELSQNSPNPFNPSTSVRYRLASAASVDLSVFDLLGRRVATLESGFMPAGSHRAVWNGADRTGRRAASGVYFVRLESRPSGVPAVTLTRKMILAD